MDNRAHGYRAAACTCQANISNESMASEMNVYDVIVLGVGGVGSAALFHLAQRNVRVLGIDAFEVGHDRGSSHGQTRIIRQAYFEHPSYVPLVQRSCTLWSELEQRSGQQLFHQVGLLQVGPKHGEVVRGVLASARAHRLHVEELTAAETERRWPQFRVPDRNMGGVFEPSAGYLEVENCVQAHVDAAKGLGAELMLGERVRAWNLENGRVRIQTDSRTVHANRLVIAAGAWAGELLKGLGLELAVLRKPVFWYAPPKQRQFTQGCPCFLFEAAEGEFYGFPALEPYGVKVAEHTGGDRVDDRLAVSRDLQTGDRERIERFTASCLPGLGRQLTRHVVCLYTMSPDRHFVVDRHPEYSQVVLAAGLSGHGFKFSPVLGEVLADLALEGTTTQPTEFLRWPRCRAL